MTGIEFAVMLVKLIVIYVTIIHVVPIMIWVERKGAALIQDRPGPNRVGPFGLLQPVADALKFLLKEDPIPVSTNHVLFAMAPFLTLIPASLITAALPFGDHFVVLGKEYHMQIADLNVGIL